MLTPMPRWSRDLGQPVAVRPVCRGDQVRVAPRNERSERGAALERCLSEAAGHEAPVFLASAEPADDPRCEERLWRGQAGRCGVARPSPVLGCCTQSGLDGVRGDVADDGERIAVVGDQLRPVPALEDVPGQAVVAVEPDGVGRVEAVHRFIEVRPGRLDEEVIVVRHQAVGVAQKAVEATGDGKPRQEDLVVRIGEERRCLGVSPGRDVVDQARGEWTMGATHPTSVGATPVNGQLRDATPSQRFGYD